MIVQANLVQVNLDSPKRTTYQCPLEVITSKTTVMEVLKNAGHIPVTIIFIIVGGLVSFIVWILKQSIQGYIKGVSDQLENYQKIARDNHIAIKESFTDIKTDFKDLNSKVAGLENQLANLATSNQEVSFRVTSLQDKVDLNSTEVNKDLKDLSKAYSKAYQKIFELEKKILTLQRTN